MGRAKRPKSYRRLGRRRTSRSRSIGVGRRGDYWAGESGFLAVKPPRLPGQARCIQITMDEHLLRDVDNAAAAKSSMSRSHWLVAMVRRGFKHRSGEVA